MKESAFRGEIRNLLLRCHFWVITQLDTWRCSKCGTLLHPPIGRPDLICLHPHAASKVIEVKMFPTPRDGVYSATSFPFSKITPEQRVWLTMWEKDCNQKRGGVLPGANGAFMALGMRHGRAGALSCARLAWLVPWAEWLKMEAMLVPIQGSLPFVLKRGLSREIQDGKLVALHLLEKWRLVWNKSQWHFREDHPLYTERERDVAKWKQRWKEYDKEEQNSEDKG